MSIAPPAGYFGSKTRNFIFSQFLPNGSWTNQNLSAPPPATSPSSTPTTQLFLKSLRWGMHDPDVARLQGFLAKNPALYPEGKVTGYFGNATLDAVQQLQLKYDLAHTGDAAYGYVGPQTRAKLNGFVETSLTP